MTEASGNKLNIIGTCEFYVKLPFLRTAKKLECLVLRGKAVDREILISCETLLKWDLIHSSFGQETVTDYCNRCQNCAHSCPDKKDARDIQLSVGDSTSWIKLKNLRLKWNFVWYSIKVFERLQQFYVFCSLTDYLMQILTFQLKTSEKMEFIK